MFHGKTGEIFFLKIEKIRDDSQTPGHSKRRAFPADAQDPGAPAYAKTMMP